MLDIMTTRKLMPFMFFIGLVIFFICFLCLIIYCNPHYLIPTGLGFFMFSYSALWMSADDYISPID